LEELIQDISNPSMLATIVIWLRFLECSITTDLQ
jgi:hypothetical protein